MPDKFFIDKYGLKRPRPPEGWVPFKFKTKKMPDYTATLCPECNSTGFCSGGSLDYTDPEVKKELKRLEAQGIEDAWLRDYEGSPIRDHWSRFGTMACMHCRAMFWHDFVNKNIQTKGGSHRYIDWQYYKRPKNTLKGFFK